MKLAVSMTGQGCSREEEYRRRCGCSTEEGKEMTKGGVAQAGVDGQRRSRNYEWQRGAAGGRAEMAVTKDSDGGDGVKGARRLKAQQGLAMGAARPKKEAALSKGGAADEG